MHYLFLEIGSIQQKNFGQYCLERIPVKKLRYTLIDKHESFKMGPSE
jgi:hypothetical protein